MVNTMITAIEIGLIGKERRENSKTIAKIEPVETFLTITTSPFWK